MFRHILLPTDGSELSDRAARIAIALAKSLHARLTAIHVIPPYLPPIPDMTFGYTHMISEEEYERSVRKEAGEILAKVVSEARNAQVGCDILVEVAAAPWEAIVKAAEGNRCDLIAMASHGRRGLAGLLLGSETQKVLTHSSIPVLVCR
jgi:nucleotide-binding universal stress UspA family protein